MKRLFIRRIVLSLVVLSLPVSALAQTPSMSDLQQMIASLQAQIASLQAQLKQQNAPQQEDCYTLRRNLRIGDASSDVQRLQSDLRKAGLDPTEKGNINYFGEFTAQAVVEFQEKYADEILIPNGLTRGTGFVGAATRAKLNQLFGCGAPTTTPPETPSQPQAPVTVVPDTSYPRLSITIPRTGDQFSAGGTYDGAFNWNGFIPKNLQIYLYNTITGQTALSNIGAVGGGASAGDKKFSFTIPSTTTSGSNYQIGICDEGTSAPGKPICTWTEGFVIIKGVTASNQSAVTVTYPNGGEQLLIASTKDVDFRVTWISSNLSGTAYVYLNFVDGGTCLLGSAPVSQGNFPVTLTKDYQCSNIPAKVTAGQYKILLATDTPSPSGSLKGVSDSSDNYFTLSTSTTPSPITFVSPYGGQQWVIGSTQTLAWSFPSAQVYIKLRKNSVGDTVRAVSGTISNTGSFSWQIPTDLPAGNDYVIRLVSSDASASLDSAPFTITAPTVPPSVPFTYEGQIFKKGEAWNLRIPQISGASVYLMNFWKENADTSFWENNREDHRWSYDGSYMFGPENPKYSEAPCNANMRFESRGYTPNGWTDSRWVTVRVVCSDQSLPVTVLSPNDGEDLLIGSNFDIRWSGGQNASGTYSGVDIHLLPRYCDINNVCGPTTEAYHIIGNGALRVASLPWVVGRAAPNVNYPNGYTIPSGTYYVQVCVSGTTNCDVSNGPFKIYSLASRPSITTTYPNGGERLTLGNAYDIKWKAQNVKSFRVSLCAVVSTGLQCTPLSSELSTTQYDSTGAAVGLYRWTVDQKTYSVAKIRVSDASNPNIYDDSDASFTTAPPEPVSNVLTVLQRTDISNQTAPQGATSVLMSGAALDGSLLSDSASIVSIPLTLSGTGNPFGVTNCRIFEGPVARTSGSNSINPTQIEASYTFTLDTPLVLAKKTISYISVRCDISLVAQGTYKWGVQNAPYVLNASSTQKIDVSFTPFIGPVVTVEASAGFPPIPNKSVVQTQELSFPINVLSAQTAPLTWALSGGAQAAGAKLLMLGDTSLNGAFSSLDASYIQQYLAGTRTLTEGQRLLADVNQDGTITSADADRILQIAVGTASSTSSTRVFVWQTSTSTLTTNYGATVTVTNPTSAWQGAQSFSVTVTPRPPTQTFSMDTSIGGLASAIAALQELIDRLRQVYGF